MLIANVDWNLKLTNENLTLGEGSRVSESQEAGHGVAEDGDQPHGRELLVVEVDEGLDGQLVDVVAGDHRVVHDLFAEHVINLAAKNEPFKECLCSEIELEGA